MKKSIVAMLLIAPLLLTACGNEKDNNSNKNTESKTESKSQKQSPSSNSVKPSANAKNRTWTYKNDVFDAGIETYKFTKFELRDSVNASKKILVLYCDITNNSTSKPDPSLVTLVMDVSQNTKTSEKELSAGILSTGDNTTLRKYEDSLYDKLLPGKTTHAVIEYELVNNSPVTIAFKNADDNVIGSKILNLNKLTYIRNASN